MFGLCLCLSTAALVVLSIILGLEQEAALGVVEERAGRLCDSTARLAGNLLQALPSLAPLGQQRTSL